MRRRVPLTIAFLTGVVMIIQFFIPHRFSKDFYFTLLDWYIIVAAFSLVLGVQSLVHVHIHRIRKRREGFTFSIVTILAMAITAVAGVFFGTGKGSFFIDIYKFITVPMGATMFSLLAFFMASAAFRAFRARNLEATLLLAAAVIVMLGRVPIGFYLFPPLPNIVEWILSHPSLAAYRGIAIGVGLGMIGTALKIILGVERRWLGERR
ncbi:MAG TPA: hypothetical protein EYP24_03035 [bacterium (Candidatus Stahlbacteria)]|nr:hypothetical protein [Candidatus Stahlbacteria bacterium]